jgi:glycosyltransferase involved in cell wall biosynthesis
MASGLPIVTTDDPGYDMYGLDHSLVTLLGPERVLDDIIDALLSDPERCQRMAHYSRRFAEQHFSWEQHISTLRNAFDRAVLAPQCTSEHPRTSLVRP